jgi:BirA family biotin operon repressor/biotin-[acetyl-CoA-carboxylase] ligase
MRILDILSTGVFVSGEEIAREMKVSRAAVHKHMEKLRQRGYGIRGEKKRGYALVSRPDLLSPEEVLPLLGAGALFGRNIIHHEETVSTQLDAKALADEGAPEGTMVAAERQSGGYGRLKREWRAPAGGLWFSVVLRPDMEPDRIPQITLMTSVSLACSLENALGAKAEIKWPNDLVAGGRKIVGILTEMSAEVGKTNWVVTGIGLNVNNRLPESLRQSAVSLGALLERRIHRPELLAALLKGLEKDYRRFCADGFAPFAAEYNRRACLQGQRIAVESAGKALEGRVQNIDTDGYLWLKTDDGKAAKIIAGNITLLKKDGGT